MSIGEWCEGWLKLGTFLKCNQNSLSEADINRVKAIIDKLCPESLDEQIRMYLLANTNDFYHLETMDENGDNLFNGHEIAAKNAENLGEYLSKTHIEYLTAMLPTILSSNGDCGRGRDFGVGCAKGTLEHSLFLEKLVDNLSKIPFEKQNINPLIGFIRQLCKINFSLTNLLLEKLLQDKRVNKWFPLIQTTATLDDNAVLRLIKSVESQQPPIHYFQSLGYGRVHEALSDTDLCNILHAINKQPDGIKVSIEILSMRFHGRVRA